LNSWTHLTFAFSNGVISLYKNGSPVALAPSSCIVEFFCESPAMSFWFGGDVGGGAIEYYDGDFDDIGIWNRALTDAEVMALYLGEAPVLGCTDPMACNYNAEANAEDGSCVLPGCNDPAASNYSGDAACANLETCVYLPDYLPSEGLVGWWPFNGNANDESGNGNHGAEYGVLPAQDRNGVSSAAFSFGGSQHIEVSNWNALQGAEAFSVSFWAKQPTNFGWLVCFGQSSNGKGFVSGTYHWGGNSIGGQLWRYDFVSSTFASVEQNTWCNIAFVYGSNVLKVYRNGQLITSQAVDYVDVQLGAGILNFGKQVDFFEYYNGTLDDIGIWNRALTDAEVMALYLGEPPMWGCVDPTACNFNPEANADDGACVPSGCTDAAACNYDIDAGCDDGSCAPADAVVGCMEPGACNFNAAAVCAGTCVYPAAGLADCAAGGALCGEGMVWDVAAQTCTIDPDFITSIEAAAAEAAVAEALDGVCGPGTVWDSTLGMCTGAGPTATCASDLNGNGAVEIQDLLILLSDYETLCPVPEPVASACGDLSAVSFDGYSYPLVAIGSQCWFKENLRSDNYRNGDPIPGGLSNAEWTSTTAGAQAVYNEDPANLELYGRLYNWYAVNDARGLCPTGWHVPSDGEWMELEMELGMTAEQANSTGWRGTYQGTQLKSSSSDTPTWNGTNSSGFSTLPSGYRDHYDGAFLNEGYSGIWWSSSANGSSSAWLRHLSSGHDGVDRSNYNQRDGRSVRCVWDE
jgi:uncharacterized protein (TIGR02145 family)